MALLTSSSQPPLFPSGRYTHTNPLRREYGLRLLTAPLPEPLRTGLVRAWRRAASFEGKETIQAAYRQRPDDAQLFGIHPHTLGVMALTELKVSRSVVEAPIASISRETRNRLLASQGAFLQRIYNALARQVGTARALSVFQQAVDKIE